MRALLISTGCFARGCSVHLSGPGLSTVALRGLSMQRMHIITLARMIRAVILEHLYCGYCQLHDEHKRFGLAVSRKTEGLRAKPRPAWKRLWQWALMSPGGHCPKDVL